MFACDPTCQDAEVTSPRLETARGPRTQLRDRGQKQPPCVLQGHRAVRSEVNVDADPGVKASGWEQEKDPKEGFSCNDPPSPPIPPHGLESDLCGPLLADGA